MLIATGGTVPSRISRQLENISIRFVFHRRSGLAINLLWKHSVRKLPLLPCSLRLHCSAPGLADRYVDEVILLFWYRP
jgi:hypothetical protein